MVALQRLSGCFDDSDDEDEELGFVNIDLRRKDMQQAKKEKL